MSKEKTSRIDNVEKRIAAMTNVIQHLMDEIKMLKSLGVGTLEVVKKMPDYNEALKAVVADEKKEVKGEKKLEIPED